ncbi:thiamine pyrophosphate-dependent enzyme [Qipengyuania sp. JC766]|uniref:thiamine pyrophosphate-dependent enzyme n=1 Tax=Qipengyuania sp. JC766 TaxID=3232139 RepID=UPI0034580543
MDRAQIVHENFLRRVAAGDLPAGPPPSGHLDRQHAVQIFRSACLSRSLDIVSRKMQAAGEGFYTIGSSGHEAMAAVAAAVSPGDMAFLHYRDAAFQIERANQVPGQSILWDMLLSFSCSREDPISGGRHKVLGSRALNIPPQTSTIASHLPKAVGAAYSIGLAKRIRPAERTLADDAIVLCSFGDASANHSTAQGAVNTSCWTAYQKVPMPVLWVCEDNGIGISTRTPGGWIEASFAHRPGLEYFACNGRDLFETYRVAHEAAEFVRTRRRPAFLHLGTIRLYGHAGADVPTTYMSKADVEAEEADDPLLHWIRMLDGSGALDRADALRIYEDTLARVEHVRAEACSRPRLATAEDVMASLIPAKRTVAAADGPAQERRAEAFGSDLKAMEQPQIMSRLINWALTDLMLEHREITLMGEDVCAKGGVYGVTQKLGKRFGRARVIDTLLDEQSILGLGLGMAQNGMLPIPEIQFLAYYHNAEDQIRGEGATLPFFSNGQYTNPMVVRIAGLGYQKGFGGHFHNDNSFAALRDVPGLILACPSNGADAARMLRECVRLAREEQRLVVFLEPIALYNMRDLHEAGDGEWLRAYPDPGERIALGEVTTAGDGTDLAIVSYANGFHMALQAQRQLEADGIGARVIDLHWLNPLPEDALLDAVRDCERVLIVDETRRTGGLAESLMTLLAENTRKPIARYVAEDSFIATGPAYAATMPSVEGIVQAARNLAESRP